MPISANSPNASPPLSPSPAPVGIESNQPSASDARTSSEGARVVSGLSMSRLSLEPAERAQSTPPEQQDQAVQRQSRSMEVGPGMRSRSAVGRPSEFATRWSGTTPRKPSFFNSRKAEKSEPAASSDSKLAQSTNPGTNGDGERAASPKGSDRKLTGSVGAGGMGTELAPGGRSAGSLTRSQSFMRTASDAFSFLRGGPRAASSNFSNVSDQALIYSRHMSNPMFRADFLEFLKKEYNSENLTFLVKCNEQALELSGPKNISNEDREKMFQEIFDNYISKGSPCEINVSSMERQAVVKEWQRLQRIPIHERDYTALYVCVNQLIGEVSKALRFDGYTRFQSSEANSQASRGSDKGGKERLSEVARSRLTQHRWPARFESSSGTSEVKNGGAEVEDERADVENAITSVRDDFVANNQYDQKLPGQRPSVVATLLELGDVFAMSVSGNEPIDLGNPNTFAADCQEFLDNDKAEKLGSFRKVMRHVEANDALCSNTAIRANLNERFAGWSAGTQPGEKELDEIETLVLRMQAQAIEHAPALQNR